MTCDCCVLKFLRRSLEGSQNGQSCNLLLILRNCLLLELPLTSNHMTLYTVQIHRLHQTQDRFARFKNMGKPEILEHFVRNIPQLEKNHSSFIVLMSVLTMVIVKQHVENGRTYMLYRLIILVY